MALTKYKLGELIELSEERNFHRQFTLHSVRGIATKKEFIETKADMDGVSLNSYKIVYPNFFAYVPDTSRRGDKISLSINKSNNVYLVSSISTVFKISNHHILLPDYLFMYFNRPEFDRYSRFNSWGSARETFSWEEMCDIDIVLPPIEIQKKYVDGYNSMVENQTAYERGLEDLKLVCDGFIEDLRRKMLCEKIGQYLEYHDIRNSDNKCTNVKGVTVYKNFREPTSKVNRDELRGYKIVKPSWITFVQTTHNEKVFAYAFNNTNEDIVVSSVNEVFSTNTKKLLPQYLCVFFNRKEFDRYARFHSWGSARETFTWNDLIEVAIPIPDIDIQQSIVDIYNQYITRKEINEKLKTQIKDLCPILIKGSLQEA